MAKPWPGVVGCPAPLVGAFQKNKKRRLSFFFSRRDGARRRRRLFLLPNEDGAPRPAASPVDRPAPAGVCALPSGAACGRPRSKHAPVAASSPLPLLTLFFGERDRRTAGDDARPATARPFSHPLRSLPSTPLFLHTHQARTRPRTLTRSATPTPPRSSWPNTTWASSRGAAWAGRPAARRLRARSRRACRAGPSRRWCGRCRCCCPCWPSWRRCCCPRC